MECWIARRSAEESLYVSSQGISTGFCWLARKWRCQALEIAAALGSVEGMCPLFAEYFISQSTLQMEEEYMRRCRAVGYARDAALESPVLSYSLRLTTRFADARQVSGSCIH